MAACSIVLGGGGRWQGKARQAGKGAGGENTAAHVMGRQRRSWTLELQRLQLAENENRQPMRM